MSDAHIPALPIRCTHCDMWDGRKESELLPVGDACRWMGCLGTIVVDEARRAAKLENRRAIHAALAAVLAGGRP